MHACSIGLLIRMFRTRDDLSETAFKSPDSEKLAKGTAEGCLGFPDSCLGRFETCNVSIQKANIKKKYSYMYLNSSH